MKPELIEIAREAGFTIATGMNKGKWPCVDGVDIEDELTRFATLVRNAALEEAAQQTGEFAQAWWSKHCASNKHMETTRAAHDDFCSLQIKIRNLKEVE